MSHQYTKMASSVRPKKIEPHKYKSLITVMQSVKGIAVKMATYGCVCMAVTILKKSLEEADGKQH